MTEAQARELLLVRAYESPPTAPWTDADGAWAGAEALRRVGATAGPEALLLQRARLATERLVQRAPEVGAALRATTVPGWLASALPVGALLFGGLLDATGGGARISIIALPFVGLLAWNVTVYAALLLGAPGQALLRPLQAALDSGIRRATRGRGEANTPLARYAADWLHASRALQTERLALLLHAGAALVALGLVLGLYWRGVGLEYRVGWDSTFLNANHVHALVSGLLGPASALSGIALPDADALARLQFSRGPGENAARWIHLLALTVAGVVLLPRTLLALRAAWRARRLAADLPVPLAAPYFQRLLRELSGTQVAVRVLPYSYHLPPAHHAALAALLRRELGGVALQVADPVAYGDEADPAAWQTTPGAGLLLPLFSLAATPERENHGAFLDALGSHGPVLVDEAGFRQRFAGRDGASRIEQKRAAWRRLLDERQLAAVFVDLSAGDVDDDAASALRDVLKPPAA